MFRRIFIVSALASFIALPSLAQADEPAEPHLHWCVLARYDVTQVGSLYMTQQQGRGTVRRVIGAQLFVPAQPGLTAEWIQANIQRHQRETKVHRTYDCPLDLENVSLNVVSGGTGFWIQISSRDSDTAKEILNRAKRVIR
jgi:hypothetical protein